MSVRQTQERILGSKKMAIVCDLVMKNLRQHEVSQALAVGDFDQCCAVFYNFFLSGGSIHVRDMHTRESFLHILADYTHLYLSADACRIFYAMCLKVDMDYTDLNGDTALHKVVRVRGAWRPIVALMRCGANPLIKNKAGRTPEEEILHLKNIGYQENLHWLRKFLPGLWAAVLSRQPDLPLVERLLRYWCRTSKIEGKDPQNLKCVMQMMNVPLDFVCIVEKYENTNEMAVVMMTGKTLMAEHWMRIQQTQGSVDVNTKDHSYQFHYREYPTAPRPLLAAVWEMDDFELIKGFMQLNPDTSIKYTFESEGSSPPKPLFFQLVNPKSRPHNEAITAHILSFSDLNLRTREGRTILMEAMYNGETEGIIRTILNAGVNIAARDGLGRTARDHAEILKRPDYIQLIDSRVTELIYSGEVAMVLTILMQLYPYVTHNLSKLCIVKLLRHHVSLQMVDTLKGSTHTQSNVRKLFSYAKSGNKAQFVKLMTQSYGACRDKAGRSLLHVAIQYSPSSHRPTAQDSVMYQNSANSRNRDFREPLELTSSSSQYVNDSDEILLLSGNASKIINIEDSPLELEESVSKLCGKKNPSKTCKFFLKNTRIFHSNFKPDHLGIVAYLVNEFPYMVDLQNSFGQTPLHYAFIYSAPMEILNILGNPGSQQNMKDVFDLLPKDYCKELCGDQTFYVRRKPAVEMDLEIFLAESNFKENFYKAISGGEVEAVKKLAVPLLKLNGQHKFSNALFDCLDMGQFDIAWYLVDAGFPWDISKQYETCNPDNPMCAMMECNHEVTSLHQRAVDTGAVQVANLIDRKKQVMIDDDVELIG